MNPDIIAAITRIVAPLVAALGAWLAARGWSAFSDVGVQGALVTFIVSAVSVAWTIRRHSDAGNIKTVAAIDPGVQVVVPAHIIAADKAVEAVVDDKKVPNVTGDQLDTARRNGGLNKQSAMQNLVRDGKIE